MALVSEFRNVPGETHGLHKPVTCGWKIFEVDGSRILQLDTYGTDERVIPGKRSQSFQVDRAGAEELLRLLQRAFPGLGA